MALHRKKEDALLVWINSLGLDDPIDHILLLQDGVLLVKLIYKLKRQAIDVQSSLDQTIQGRLQFVSEFLQSDCRYRADRGAVVSWDNILNGKNLDVELSKVVVLLLYYAVMNGLLGLDKLDYKVELELASVLRFVLNNEDSLYLSDNLEKFLKKQPMLDFSSVSSTSSFSDEESPIFSRRRRPEVQFLELKTVASSSVGSPIQDILNTPQFQLRKLQKQLAQERDMRDELERELANSSQVIVQREMQVSQLQQRVHRMIRDNAEQEQQPKELEELQSKNEGLLTRLHDILKQCQDLKTNKTQMERKIDDLTEENGNLSVQMREVLSRLAGTQAAVDKLSEEQESSGVEWANRRAQLESELSQAVSQRDNLSEQIQILQGKISILEDELCKAQAQTHEKGEVMGPVIEREILNQEIAELTLKLSQSQETILRLEQEKIQMERLCDAERIKFQAENLCLEELVSELKQKLKSQQDEKEALEQASNEQRAMLSAQIDSLSADVVCLTETVCQRELEVATLSQQLDEERKRTEELTGEMKRHEQVSLETIHGLNQRVDSLEIVLKVKEEEALVNAEAWEQDRKTNSLQKKEMMEAHQSTSKERDDILSEYHHFRQEKDEEVGSLGQQILLLEDQWRAEQSFSLELQREKRDLEEKVLSLEAAICELRSKCQGLELDSEVQRNGHLERVESFKRKLQEAEVTLREYEGKLADHNKIFKERIALCEELSIMKETARDLRVELEAEKRKHEETVAVKLQKDSQMAEEIQELGNRMQKMSMEVERLSQELNKAHLDKVYAESCVAKLTEEGLEVTNALTLSRDQALFTVREREAEILKLTSEIKLLSDKLKLVEETKTKELAEKGDAMRELVRQMENTRVELGVVKKAKGDLETDFESRIENEHKELLALHLKMNDVQVSVENKENEIEILKAELSLKVEELKTQQELVFCLQSEKAKMEELKKQLAEEEKRSLVYRQEVDSKEEEVLYFKTTLAGKEDEIKSCLETIRIGEEKVSALQDLQERNIEDQKRSASTLELQLFETKRLLMEKVTAFEMQASEVKNLEGKLSVEQMKTVSLQQSLIMSESAIGDYKKQEQALKSEVISLQEDIKTLKEELEELSIEAGNLRLEGACCNELVEKVAHLQAQVTEASSLASEKESELNSLRKEVEARDSVAEAQSKELVEKVACLQAQVTEASSLASERESELNSLRKEAEARDSVAEAQRKELVEKVACLQAQVTEASSLASEKESELNSLRKEAGAKDSVAEAQRKELVEKMACLQAQGEEASERESELNSLRKEMEARDSVAEAQRKELVEKMACLQAQGEEASERESELNSLRKEMEARDSVAEAQRKELAEKVACLQAQVTEASSLASERESELNSLRKEAEARDSVAEAQRKELAEKVACLQAQASRKESELNLLCNEIKEKDKMTGAQRVELEETITKLREEIHVATSQAVQKEQLNERLTWDLKKLDVQLQGSKEREVILNRTIVTEELTRKEMEETISKLKAEVLRTTAEQTDENLKQLRLENETLLSLKESLLKEREASQRLEASLQSKLELAREELATLLPLRKLNDEFQDRLKVKSEALEHYKTQAMNHYNGKKQQLLEATERVQALESTLESREREVKTLKRDFKMLQKELELAKTSEGNLALKVKSLQAQMDYADRQLRGQKKPGRDAPRNVEPISLKIPEKGEDTSKDSLDFSLDDSLDATRRPSTREDSSTPMVRSSERLAAKRQALGRGSLETLYFTPMSSRIQTERKLESSIASISELALDSAKKGHSARRRTTQVINITMTKETLSRAEADGENGSFYSLRSEQSYPNFASQSRPVSAEFSEDTAANDQLLNLPGYRRSAIHGTALPRSASTFAVGAENEPEVTDDWMRIAELQTRNKACKPHLKSSYPLESRPVLGNPSFTITDDDLRLGDPDETIRRASMMPGQIWNSTSSHRNSLLPGQIRDGVSSQRTTMLPGQISAGITSHVFAHPKSTTNVGQMTAGTTLSLKRGNNDLLDTPEAKKTPGCFSRPMTPKARNDRRFASQNIENRPPNTPAERRQSMMFSIDNTPKKHGKSNILQRGISKMRSSARKSPGSISKVQRAGKSPRSEKSPKASKSQRQSPRNSSKSPKITASTKKMSYRSRMKF